MSRTITLTTTQVQPSGGSIVLRGPAAHVQWETTVVDNENMGKKSSKSELDSQCPHRNDTFRLLRFYPIRDVCCICRRVLHFSQAEKVGRQLFRF